MEGPELQAKFHAEAVLVANAFVAGYIFLHKVVIPVTAGFLTETNAPEFQRHEMGYWWLFHAAIWIFLLRKTPRSFRLLCMAVCFGLGFIPVAVLHMFCTAVTFSGKWGRLAGIVTYGSSGIILMAVSKYILRSEVMRRAYGVAADRAITRNVLLISLVSGILVSAILAFRLHPISFGDF